MRTAQDIAQETFDAIRDGEHAVQIRDIVKARAALNRCKALTLEANRLGLQAAVSAILEKLTGTK